LRFKFVFMPAFTDTLWQAAEPIYKEILAHPFLRGLTDGTLPEAAFRHYVIQDSHYLCDYGRGLALLGAKAPVDDDFMMFAQHATGAILAERMLHDGFLKAWGLDRTAVFATPIAPACHHYTAFLMRTVLERPYHEALGAFLPCYWIYWEVGKALLCAGSPNPLYQKWIANYSNDEFAAVVRQVLAVVNRTCAQLTDEQRAAVTRHFVTGSRFEWMFWDGAWRLETWAV
jgi:thiaminase/transcriptional activator TenA